ncbi:MAG: beta-lactamase family protein, partial [Clostridia bacterium]|nr:beta-lactamase family protein [Clostridia bacterium]
PGAFSSHRPGERFQYSNFAAGMVACLLEARFGVSFEALAQQYLFGPLGLTATFDLSALRDGGRFAGAPLADGYKVLPHRRKPAFDAEKRLRNAHAVQQPDPDTHYLLASGNLYVTAPAMAGLLQAAFPVRHAEETGAAPSQEPFIDAKSLRQLKEPRGQWPDHDIPLMHGMGLLTLDDPRVSGKVLYGHQGFAYGAVNGVFWTEDGDGFVSLNSGASEQRKGHVSLLNQDLIRLLIPS